MSRTLVNVDPGETARVIRVDGNGEGTQRLMDMGLIRGTSIKVVRVAPLGDPIEVNLRGYMLTLRRSEAIHVLVE